jgi:hypothetical protein
MMSYYDDQRERMIFHDDDTGALYRKLWRLKAWLVASVLLNIAMFIALELKFK